MTGCTDEGHFRGVMYGHCAWLCGSQLRNPAETQGLDAVHWRVVLTGAIPNRGRAAWKLGGLHRYNAVMEQRAAPDVAIILTIDASQAATAGLQAQRLVQAVMGDLVEEGLVIESVEMDHNT